jgi:hypothetical protein
MQRRYLPASIADSILLYGLGLALTLSLLFNGYLLYEQGRQQSRSESEVGTTNYTLTTAVWQQQLSDCQRISQQKDSLIRQLTQLANSPPGAEAISQKPPSH